MFSVYKINILNDLNVILWIFGACSLFGHVEFLESFQ